MGQTEMQNRPSPDERVSQGVVDQGGDSDDTIISEKVDMGAKVVVRKEINWDAVREYPDSEEEGGDQRE